MKEQDGRSLHERSLPHVLPSRVIDRVETSAAPQLIPVDAGRHDVPRAESLAVGCRDGEVARFSWREIVGRGRCEVGVERKADAVQEEDAGNGRRESQKGRGATETGAGRTFAGWMEREARTRRQSTRLLKWKTWRSVEAIA